MEKKDGVLELLLVSAEGLKHAHHLGKGKKVWWNEKLRFPLSSDECSCKELTKVTLKIMERDKFSEDSLVGETKVHVGDIISEGAEREFMQMKPASYNIVLEDGRYKGELKLGLKFLPNVSVECPEQSRESRQRAVSPPRQTTVAYRPFLNITLPAIPWRKLFFFCTRSDGGGSRRKSLIKKKRKERCPAPSLLRLVRTVRFESNGAYALGITKTEQARPDHDPLPLPFPEFPVQAARSKQEAAQMEMDLDLQSTAAT
ncbi:hypothetical protein E2562_039170 [Oryza meyeriana var. granulata]|uniref:C2 domain-containing protein n=1 Tax=Oryza meyeriana var. granulata TaxID=110450 RepID=A0A6G1DSN7_9ORYZ|nr:hypothetical protein E2562_039170 [Oryza meyeriana var. granulata]